MPNMRLQPTARPSSCEDSKAADETEVAAFETEVGASLPSDYVCWADRAITRLAWARDGDET